MSPGLFSKPDGTALVGVKLAAYQVELVSSYGSHFTALFSDTIKDFSLLKPDIVIQLESITRSFRDSMERGYHREFESDPASQFLYNSDPIEKDVLANNTKMKKSEEELIELAKCTRLPSPSAAVNEASRFNPVDENGVKGRKPKGGSSVALHFQKMRRVSNIDELTCKYLIPHRRGRATPETSRGQAEDRGINRGRGA